MEMLLSNTPKIIDVKTFNSLYFLSHKIFLLQIKGEVVAHLRLDPHKNMNL